MSDPFKDAIRKSSQKLNCCCDTGLVCPTHGAMGKTSDTPETDAFYAKLYAPNVPAAMIEIACGDERRKMQSFERERNEAREEVANWKQLYAEAVERGRLFQSQRDEIRQALQRIADCTDAPNIDPVGDIQSGLHCGVEDHNCIDCYEGADYGFACGVERTLEWASNETKHALNPSNKQTTN